MLDELNPEEMCYNLYYYTFNTPTLIPGELKLEEMVVGITHWVTPRPSQLSVTSNMDSTYSVHQHSSNKGPIFR